MIKIKFFYTFILFFIFTNYFLYAQDLQNTIQNITNKNKEQLTDLNDSHKQFAFPVKQVYITSLFGESRRDHFHNGLDLAKKQSIYPISHGEILLINENKNMNLGSGKYIVIQHTNNTRSYYYHLESTENTHLTEVTTNDIIGIMGNSGHSKGNHLHLIVEEISNNKIVNPLKYLPKIPDKTKPKVKTILGKIKKKYYNLNNGSIFTYFGKIELFGIIHDYRVFFSAIKKHQLKHIRPVGVKDIYFMIDNKQKLHYNFEYLKLDQHKGWVLPNQFSFNEVYGKPFNYRLGEFFPKAKKHVFQIKTIDFHNNQDTLKYNIYFRNK